MKRRMAPFVIAWVALAVPLARGEGDAAVKKDMAALQGEWAMVSGVADGYALPDDMLKTGRRVCKGDEVTVILGGQAIMRAKFTIDPTQSPKTIDYEVVEGPTKGKKHLGIYALDGDTFKSCFAAPDGARPKDFTSAAGEQRTASVWKRKKEAAVK